MKLLEKFSLTIFSIIIFIVAFVTALLILGIIDIGFIQYVLALLISSDIASKIALGVSIVLLLLVIKFIFFSSDDKEKKQSIKGALMQNADGKLLISKETIENFVNSVVNGFENTKETKTDVYIDDDNNLIITVSLLVLESTVIKELTSNIQARIKEKIKYSTDLDVKEINIKVRNLANIDEKE